MSLPVHLVQQHVGQQRTQGATLRRSLVPLDHHAISHDPGVQVGAHQPQHRRVRYPPAQPLHQDVVVHAIKELLQVHIHHHPAARLHVAAGLSHRVVRAPARAKAMAVVAEGRIDDRLQHLQQRLLDQPIQHRRDAQLALAPVRLGDHHPSHRLGPVSALQQHLAHFGPVGRQPEAGLLDVEPIHPGRALVGLHALPRPLQVLSCQGRLQQRASRCRRRSRPCGPVSMVRALGFVAHRPTSGFTAFGSESPSLRWHLTHGPRHHLGPGSLTLVRPFAAHSRPLRRCAATTASADFSLRRAGVALSGARRDLPR